MEQGLSTERRTVEFAEIFHCSQAQYMNYQGSDVGRRATGLKVGVCLIRYDLVRYLEEFDNEQLPQHARTRCAADLMKTMLEGKTWFEKKANQELRAICEETDLGFDFHAELSRKCKGVYKLTELEKYAEYRHNLSGHYDLEIASSIEKLSAVDAKSLIGDAKQFAKYLNQWVLNLRDVFEAPNKTIQRTSGTAGC